MYMYISLLYTNVMVWRKVHSYLSLNNIQTWKSNGPAGCLLVINESESFLDLIYFATCFLPTSVNLAVYCPSPQWRGR